MEFKAPTNSLSFLNGNFGCFGHFAHFGRFGHFVCFVSILRNFFLIDILMFRNLNDKYAMHNF